jgi:hypothetical protein
MFFDCRVERSVPKVDIAVAAGPEAIDKVELGLWVNSPQFFGGELPPLSVRLRQSECNLSHY